MTAVMGEWNMICDRSGRRMKSSEARREWTGLIVHRDYWEARHPQDFLRAKPDYQQVPDARPRQADRFLSVNEVTADSL